MGENKTAKIFVFLVILYITELINFLHSDILIYGVELLMYISGSIAAFNYFISPIRKVSKYSYFLLVWIALVPIYCAIRSHAVFDQPIFQGIVGMRFMGKIIFAFFLCVSKYPLQTLFKQINAVNLFIAVAGFILLYGFNIGTAKMMEEDIFYLPYEINEMGTDEIKGTRLTICANLMLVSLVYYSIRMFNKPRMSEIVSLLVLMAYILFVHKSRLIPFTLVVMIAIYVLRNLKLKNLALGAIILLVSGAFVVRATSIMRSYDAIFEGEYSTDNSVLQRITDIELLSPYIAKYPIAGIGHLAPSFNDGFRGVFGDRFYISDIGVVGTMAMGGAILMIVWILFYVVSIRDIGKNLDEESRKILRGLIILLLISALCGSDYLVNSPAIFGLFLYPMLEAGIKKYQYESNLGFRL